MKITDIKISNYRGITDQQIIPLNKFSSVVGQNDSGKSIVLNAIASFLNLKEYPIAQCDFNISESPIEIICTFTDESLYELLSSNIKSKIKKTDGLEEFVKDLLIDGALTIKKIISTPNKSFDVEQVLMKDYNSEEFSFLYDKNDEELTKIVNDNKISIPIQGIGRNSKLEKIKHIKKYCETRGISKKTKYIQDDYKICSLLPNVELFKADYGLEADTKFKTNSVTEIKEYLQAESQKNSKLDIVESEIAIEMQKEAESVKKFMDDYVSHLQKVEIRPTIVWKDAIKSVDVSFQFDGDSKPIPMSHKGAGYRRLFMVARFRYLAEKNKGLNVIYLIEEPETFLHPSAQNDLLNAFRDLSEENQVIITTHSPVFAGATSINSVVLCKKEGSSIYEHYKTNRGDDLIKCIIEELGIKPSYNLRDYHEKILFVESHNDARFFSLISHHLLENDILVNKKVLVLPFGGGEDIDSFLNIDYFDESNRDLFLIIDSDKHQDNYDKQKQRAKDFQKNKPKGKAYVLKRSCLENYYHPRAFERKYCLTKNSFPSIGEEDDARSIIKEYKKAKRITNNIKEKNNFDVLNTMTKEEWKEVVEEDLIEFIKNIVL